MAIANWNKNGKTLIIDLTSFPLMVSRPLHVSQVATCPVQFTPSQQIWHWPRASEYPRCCHTHYLSMSRANPNFFICFFFLHAVLFRPVGKGLGVGQAHEFGGFLFGLSFFQSAV